MVFYIYFLRKKNYLHIYLCIIYIWLSTKISSKIDSISPLRSYLQCRQRFAPYTPAPHTRHQFFRKKNIFFFFLKKYRYGAVTLTFYRIHWFIRPVIISTAGECYREKVIDFVLIFAHDIRRIVIRKKKKKIHNNCCIDVVIDIRIHKLSDN